MGKEKYIYHGNNEKYLKGIMDAIGQQDMFWLPSNLTDDPLQAVEFAFEMSRKFNSRPVVLEYSFNKEYFMKGLTSRGRRDGGHKIVWYRCKRAECSGKKDPLIRIYSEHDLQSFLEDKLKNPTEADIRITHLSHWLRGVQNEKRI